MKKARLILTASLLAVGSFATLSLTSCSKDDVACPVGYEGKDCKTEVRADYNNTYRGTGSNSVGETYQNWALKFTSVGTDVTKLQLQLMDADNVPQKLFDVTLNTNTTYNVNPKTTGLFSYEGNGSINATNSGLTLTEKDNTTGTVVTTIYTFANMIKE